jgi:hypothetical protein
VDRAAQAGLPRREDLAGRERLVVQQGPVVQQVLVLPRVLAPLALALSTMPAELPIRGQRPSMLGAKLTPSSCRLPVGRGAKLGNHIQRASRRSSHEFDGRQAGK